MLKHLISVLAFVVVTFGVQGLSHFAINKAHYGKIIFMRADHILPLGTSAMVVQGVIMSLALSLYSAHPSLLDGLLVSLTFGAFLGLYIALVEPSKYAVPSVTSWTWVEASASLVQFSLYGLILGLVHQSLS